MTLAARKTAGSHSSGADSAARDYEIDYSFDVLRNNRGQILLAINARPGEAIDPHIVVFGDAPYPIFHRTREQAIGLPDLNDAALSWLAQATKVLIVEMNGRELARTYEARIEILL